MNNAEMLRIIDSIARDRNLDKESLFGDIEQAMVSAARKHFNAEDTDEFTAQVDRLTNHRSLVNFVIACMNDRADGRLDAERETIDERVRDADELDLEDADIHNVARLDAMQQHIAEQLVFFEFAFSESGGEVRTVNRDIELLEQVGQRTEMIFVTVREDNGGDVLAILVEKTKVRDRDVDAVRRLFRKAHPGVENQHLVAVPHRHTIHSKLADTAEWDDLKDTSH